MQEDIKKKSSEKLARESAAKTLPKQKTPKASAKEKAGEDSSSSSEDEEEEFIEETTEILDPYAKVDVNAIGERIDEARSEQKAIKRKLDIGTPKSAVCIDPENVLTVGKVRKLKSQFKISAEGEDDEDAEEMDVDKQRQLIQEAFAGDDVVQDFIKEQKVSRSSAFAAFSCAILLAVFQTWNPVFMVATFFAGEKCRGTQGRQGSRLKKERPRRRLGDAEQHPPPG